MLLWGLPAAAWPETWEAASPPPATGAEPAGPSATPEATGSAAPGTPTALVLPPRRGERPDTTAALTAWCAYVTYPTEAACEAARRESEERHGGGFNGFTFAGAMCVPAAKVPARIERTRERVASFVGRAVAERARLHPQGRVGDLVADFTVENGERGSAAPILAVDVLERGPDRWPRASRMAAQGVPEYWQIVLDPARGVDEATVFTRPDPAHATWLQSDGGETLRIERLPGIGIRTADILPPPCQEGTSGSEPAPAPPIEGPDDRPLCDGFVFRVDGTLPSPALIFSEPNADGLPRRFRFTGTSTMPTHFDPAALAITIRGPYFGEDVLDVTLPAGLAWTTQDNGLRSWVAEQDGVRVRATNAGDHLTWDISGTASVYALPMADLGDWGPLQVRIEVRQASGDHARCGAVFFQSHGAASHCAFDARTRTLACRGPGPAPRCTATEVGARVRCALEQVAHGQSQTFLRRGDWISGTCKDLPGFEPPPGSVCTSSSDGVAYQTLLIDSDGNFHRQNGPLVPPS